MGMLTLNSRHAMQFFFSFIYRVSSVIS